MSAKVFCNENCKEAYLSDRRYGLIYGPAKMPDGQWAITWMQYSKAYGVCPYCGTLLDPEKYEAAVALWRERQENKATGGQHA